MTFKYLRFAVIAIITFCFTVQGNAQATIAQHTGTLGTAGWTETSLAQGASGGNDYLQMVQSGSLLRSSIMDLNAYTGGSLTFKARTFGGPSTAQATITVSISVNNGANWTVLGTRAPTTTTLTAMSAFNLGAYSGTQVYIKLETLGASSSKGVGVDDIIVTATSAATCTAPTLGTTSSGSIGLTTATLSSNVATVGTGGATAVTARGFEYATNSGLTTPTTTTNGTGTGNYNANLTSLTSNTQYWYRAYATNDCSTPQTVYSTTSSHASFFTTPSTPVANAAGSITTGGFSASWNDVAGGATETYDLQVATDNALANIVASQTGIATTSHNVTGLSSGTDYYYRVRATNGGGSSAWSNIIGPVTTIDNSILINATNTDFTQNFNLFAGDAGTMPTGWVSSTSTFQGSGTGSGSSAGMWAYGSGSDYSLGVLPGNATGDITLTTNFRNTTGVTINTLVITYDFEQYSYNNNTTGFVVSSALGNVSGLTQTGVSSGSGVSVTTKTITLTGLNVPNNGTFNLSWLIANQSGNDNAIAIDNFIIKANPVAAPNIQVQGNAVTIADGSTTTSATNFTLFTSAAVGVSTTRTFTINNTGTSTLNLTGTPRVAISGSSDFSVTTQPSAATIAGGGNLTFVVTFTPSSTGSKTATISILNDDPDVAEQNYTFDISGTGTGNSASDIVAATFTAPVNIAYFNYTSNNITSANSVEVGKFTIRDGGASADADANTTTLTAISFSLTNSGNIQRVALYDGATELQEVAGAAIVSFSSLSLSAPDNGTKDFSLRVTYNTTVTDNQQYQFTVTSATANASGSLFAAANAGGATTSVSANANKVIVTADRLIFSTQPQSSTPNINLSTFVVSAVDVNTNQDIDAVNAITLTTSGTGMTATGNPYTMSGGQVSISAVQFNATQNNITLTATTTGLASSNTVTSNPFSIANIVYVNGDYRTIGNGNWVSNNASPAIWEKFNGSTWVASNSPAYNTSANVYIYHSITATGSFGSSVNIKIMSGGDFTVSNSSTANTIYVYTGGTLYAEAALTINTALDVEDNADVLIDFNVTSPSTTIWKGTENFRPNSNLTIADWSDDDPLIDNDVTTNTYNGYTAAFGNVYIDLSLDVRAMNNAWTLLGTSFGTTNLTHGNFEFDSPRGYNAIFSSNSGTYNVGIGGNLKMNQNWSSARNVIVSTSSAIINLNVKGNLEINSPGTFAIRQTNAAGISTLNIDGDIIMNGANTASSTYLLLNYQSISASAGTLRAVLNLKGNLTVGALANIGNSMNPADVQFNFVSSATAHSVNVANAVGTSPSSASGVPFYINSGATVRLVNSNLSLNYGSSLTVETGGALDFNWNGSNTPLLVTQPASPSGSNSFASQQGSTLYITSPDGITTTTGVGNVQVSASNRTFNQTAYFYYTGKTNQVTGNALTSGSNGKVVVANLINNATTLTLSNNVGISSGATIEATGGRLEIQKGTVVGSAAADFSGTGRLVMTDGTYQMSETGSTLPLLTGYVNYSLTGGTVELNGAGAQTLSSAPSSFYNVKISGSNTSGVDEKTISTGTLTINNNLFITATAIFNTASNGVVGNAGLKMDGGRWRFSKIATLPELTATAASQSYNLTGGTIEYYGTSNVQQQTIRGTDGNSNNITYYIIEVNSTGSNITDGNVNANASFAVNGGLTVFSPAALKLNPTNTITGTGTFEVKPDATLLYGSTDGITTSGATGNIRVTGTRTYQSTASYGFIGSGNMVTGNGLPAAIKNLYLNKTSSTNTVTLTNGLAINGDIDLASGLLLLGGKDVTLSATTTVTGTPSSTAMVVTNGIGQLVKTFATGASAFTYPVGDNVGTIEYSPATLTFSANATQGKVGVIVTDATHPNMGGSTDYASRYWTLGNNGLTTYSYTADYTYTASDVVGNQNLYKASRWDGSTWNEVSGSSASANIVSITSAQTQTTSPLSGDYTARLAVVSAYTWVGNTDDWNVATNWSPASVPPAGCSANVIIPTAPAGGNFPAINVTTSVGDIKVYDNARIFVNAKLNVCGTWEGGSTNAATIIGTEAVVLNGSTAQDVKGRTQFNTLHLNNTSGAVMQSGSKVEIFTALELEHGNLDASAGELKFRSVSSTECGIINNFGSGYNGTLNGAIKAERYYDAPTAANSFNQHYMGSPVNAPALTQFGASGTQGFIVTSNCYIDVLAPGSPRGTMYAYDETNGASCGANCWKVVTAGNAENGKGYSVSKNGTGVLTLNGNANLDATYTVNGLGNSNWSNSASYNVTAPFTTITIKSGWHLIANPYLATLNVQSHAANNNFDAQIQVWETTGPFAGSYQPFTAGSNASIAPFQAFMVHKTNAGGSANYTLYASDRATAAQTFYRQAAQHELKVYAKNNTTGRMDVTTVAFNTDATAHFDPAYDADKVTGDPSRQTLYTIGTGNQQMAINNYKSIDETDNVPMGMRPGVNGTYTFSIAGIQSFDPTSYIYLEDKVTGQWIDLRQNPDYTFTMTTTENADRFVLHFTPAATINTTDATCSNSGNINITQPGIANWTYTVQNGNNATISSGTLNQNNTATVSAATGVYNLTLTDNNGYTVVKNIQINGADAVSAGITASTAQAETNETIDFTASIVTTANNDTYNWQFGDGNTANTETAAHSYTSVGVYNVMLTVTNSNGCSASSNKLVTVTAAQSTGINNLADNNGITVWSNSNKVNVDFSKLKNVEATVDIYNILGQTLSSDKVTTQSIYSKEVPNTEAAYVIVKVTNDGKIITRKLFISNK